MERLTQFVTRHLPIEEISVVHGNAAREAEGLVERIRSISPQSRPIISKLGSALGVHGGPGTLVVALREGTGEPFTREGKAKRFTLPTLPTLRIPHRQ